MDINQLLARTHLNCAQSSVSFWADKEKEERQDPSFKGETHYRYLNFIKHKLKEAQAEVEYFQAELAKLSA